MKKNAKINWLDFIIPATLLAVFTFIFRLTSLDLELHSYFWKQGAGWFLKNAQPWDFIYHYSNLPALAISIISLIVLAWGFYRQRLRKYRKLCLFLVLGMVVGPGLIVNSVLKDNWGRPRPRNIENFGGEYQYEQILEIDPSSSGKSFPCGHCSMGFYFFVLFLLLRRSHRTWAIISLTFGLLLGGIIGVARLAQGGHFVSDIIWSAGLVYMSSAVLYYILGLHKSIFYYSAHPIDKHKVKIVAGISLLVILLIAAILSASPYEKSKTLEVENSIWKQADSLFLSLEAERADFELIATDSLAIVLEASGHGFPGSKLKTKWKKKVEGKTLLASFSQRESGFFTEIAQTISIHFPKNKIITINLANEKGNLLVSKAEFSKNIVVQDSNLNGKIIKK